MSYLWLRHLVVEVTGNGVSIRTNGGKVKVFWQAYGRTKDFEVPVEWAADESNAPSVRNHIARQMRNMQRAAGGAEKPLATSKRRKKRDTREVL